MPIYSRKSSILCALTPCAWILCASAGAQAEPPPKPAQEEVTTYTFDDDAVLGDTVGAMGEVLHVRQRPRRESLIRVRDSFMREVLRSVEAL
jgi:hypothetical protein